MLLHQISSLHYRGWGKAVAAKRLLLEVIWSFTGCIESGDQVYTDKMKIPWKTSIKIKKNLYLHSLNYNKNKNSLPGLISRSQHWSRIIWITSEPTLVNAYVCNVMDFSQCKSMKSHCCANLFPHQPNLILFWCYATKAALTLVHYWPDPEELDDPWSVKGATGLSPSWVWPCQVQIRPGLIIFVDCGSQPNSFDPQLYNGINLYTSSIVR